MKTPLNTPMRSRFFSLTSLLLFLAPLCLLSLSAPPRASAQSTPSPAASTTSASPATRITQAIDETKLVTIRGNVHPLARAEFDQGAAPDSQPMNRILLLLQRSADQQAALSKLMHEQVTPGSANFHNWLTPQQFGAQFGPSDADVQTVTTWLTQHGFQGIKVANGKVAIEFSGNVAQVRNTFHTGIHHFMVNGQLRSANISDPQIPAALTPVVQGIVSLHNFPRKSHLHNRGTQLAKRDSSGNPQFTGPANCGTTGNPACSYIVGPADFAKIYNTPTTTVCPGTVVCDGTGVTIGIVGDSNINAQDAADFRALFGLSTNAVQITVDGPDPGLGGPNSDEIEADLDTQVSGMVAQNATINFFVAENTFTANGTDLAAFHIIDYNSADIISESFGTCEPALGLSGESFYSGIWEQAAAQGISAFVSAGDNGAAACDDFNTENVATQGLAVNGLASSQFNVAVGGTDFDDAGTQTNFWSSVNGTGKESALGYIHEIPWNDSCAAGATSSNLNTVCANATNIVAASGGQSIFTNRPNWQNGLTPSGATRLLPDVSLFASDGPTSNSFYLVCEADAIPSGQPPSCASSGQFSFFQVGGTSASSPAFAGIMALIDQSQGGRQGNPNPLLYKIAATTGQSCNSSTEALTGSTCAFNDVTTGNNSVPCAGDTTKTTNCSSSTANVNGVLVEPTSSTTPAWTAVAGYDLATGLGSVNIANLATQWKTAVGNLKGTTTSLKLNGGTSAITITHGASVTATATVAPLVSSTTNPMGDVSLLGPQGTINSGINAATLTGTSTDTANLTTTFLPGSPTPGTPYNVKAHYAGDGTFAPSDSSPIAVTVNPEQSTLQMEVISLDPNSGAALSLNATSYTYGSPVIMRFDILNSSGNACQIVIVSGQVTFGNTTTGCATDAQGSVSVTDNGGVLSGSPFNINSEGHAEDQNFNLTAGSTAHAISATYSGDVNYKPPASPVTTSITVSQAATSTGLASSALTVTETTPVTITATIGTNSVSSLGPTGTVTFFNGTTQIGTPIAVTPSGATSTLFASGTAAMTTSFSTLGSQSITAKYSGDTNYSLSTASAITINVTSPGSFTMAAGPATVSTTAGSGSSSGTSTVTLTPSGGFNGPVAITCASIPGVTCNPLTITTPGSTTGTLTINVANPSSSMTAMAAPQTQYLWAANRPVTPKIKTGLWTFSGGTGLAAIFLLLLPGRKRLRAALGLGLMCVLSFALGCGGYSGGGGGITPVSSVTKLTVSSTKIANSANASITVSAVVTGKNPTGSVQFLVDNTAVVSAAPLTAGSTGNITVTAAQAPAFLQLVGTHSVTAQYSSDAYNLASSSGVLNVTITGTTQLGITANPAASNAASNPSVALTIN